MKIGWLVLLLSLAAQAIAKEVNALADPDNEAYEELREKVRAAKQTVPWRIFDSYEEFRGQYVRTFGYLAYCDNKITLFPSREFAEIPLFRYFTEIPEYSNPFNGYIPRAGDFVEIIAKVTENERWNSIEDHVQIFDEIVLINLYAPPYKFCASPTVDEECPAD